MPAGSHPVVPLQLLAAHRIDAHVPPVRPVGHQVVHVPCEQQPVAHGKPHELCERSGPLRCGACELPAMPFRDAPRQHRFGGQHPVVPKHLAKRILGADRGCGVLRFAGQVAHQAVGQVHHLAVRPGVDRHFAVEDVDAEVLLPEPGVLDARTGVGIAVGDPQILQVPRRQAQRL